MIAFLVICLLAVIVAVIMYCAAPHYGTPDELDAYNKALGVKSQLTKLCGTDGDIVQVLGIDSTLSVGEHFVTLRFSDDLYGVHEVTIAGEVLDRMYLSRLGLVE